MVLVPVAVAHATTKAQVFFGVVLVKVATFRGAPPPRHDAEHYASRNSQRHQQSLCHKAAAAGRLGGRGRVNQNGSGVHLRTFWDQKYRFLLPSKGETCLQGGLTTLRWTLLGHIVDTLPKEYGMSILTEMATAPQRWLRTKPGDTVQSRSNAIQKDTSCTRNLTNQ